MLVRAKPLNDICYRNISLDPLEEEPMETAFRLSEGVLWQRS
jgi:hypothetical protein